MHRYFLVNKPQNMLSQFVSDVALPVLRDLDFDFPEGTHAIGRLDKPSEGLLLLTTNSAITKLLFQAKVPHNRIYLVMVKGIVSDNNIDELQKGIEILLNCNKGLYTTKPCKIKKIANAKDFCNFATDHREQYPHTWLLMQLTEGKFRQIRKMVMAIKHPCMRLIRLQIAKLQLPNTIPGTVTEVTEEFFMQGIC